MTPSASAFALIKEFEGCAKRMPDGSLHAYPDPGTGGAPWTIGWGNTGPDVGPGTVWTQAQADARLTQRVNTFAAAVTAMLHGVATTQNQFDAMVDFCYNEGPVKLQTSTLMRKHCAGDHAGAQAEFAKWIFADGHIMSGLIKRRAAEAALYGRK